jgi:molybdopterin converting factor small subunit
MRISGPVDGTADRFSAGENCTLVDYSTTPLSTRATMGCRNHLHVCQHCGVVHATASTIGPNRCMGCNEQHFSEYVPANTVTWDLYSEFKRAVGERPVRVDIETPATARDALAVLVDRHPGLDGLVFDDDRLLVRGVHVLNHGDVMAADGLDTPVHTGDELGLFTAYGTVVEPADLS